MLHLVGLFWARQEAVQLVYCLRRPVRLKAPNQDLGHTRQHEPPSCKSVLSARFTARSLRQFDQCTQVLANQQKDGDSPVKTVVQGLQERSRLRLMERLGKFIMVDNHEAVEVGDLDKNMRGKW